MTSRVLRLSSKNSGNNPFSSRDDSSDLTLVVEGKRLYVSKLVLTLASPVFKILLNGEFLDKSVMPIPNKTYNEFVELLLCIYPSTHKPITMTNMDAILPLANEYAIASVKKQCEELIKLEVQKEDGQARDRLAHVLYLTDAYRLPQGLRICVDKMKNIPFSGHDGYKNNANFERSSLQAKYSLITERLISFESAAQAIIICDTIGAIKKLKDPFVNAQCVGCKKKHEGKHTSCICEAIAETDVRDFVQKFLKLFQFMK